MFKIIIPKHCYAEKVIRRESACSVYMLRDKLASKQNMGEVCMKKQKSIDKHQLKDGLQSDIKAKLAWGWQLSYSDKPNLREFLAAYD